MSASAFISPSLPTSRISWQRQPLLCMTAEEKNEAPNKSSNTSNEESTKAKKTIRSNASWANDFFPGFGKKGPGSRPDWDLRPKSLRSKEEGSGICDSCKGTGLMTCSFCQGGDYFKSDGSHMKCPACDSKKTITCSACFGSKKQVELVRFSHLYREISHFRQSLINI